MTIKIVTDKNLKERIAYADDAFPFAVFADDYSIFTDKTLNYHWHYDFEFSYVVTGAVDYYINDTRIELHEGDCIFVNSNMLHMGKQPVDCEKTEVFTTTFPTVFLSADTGNLIYTKYMQPVLSSGIEGFKVAYDNPDGTGFRNALDKIRSIDGSDASYEMNCNIRAGELWLETWRFIENKYEVLYETSKNTQQAERMKEILSFIHEHYNEKITADDIATGVNISRAECFRCFRRFMNKTPTKYINEYRLLKAARMILETEESITEIYTKCGFENASYFTKLFKDKYALTPKQYRLI